MRIVTLCGCGLGTCFILKFTAEKAVRELGIQASVIPGGISSYEIEDADLYLIPYGLDATAIGRKGLVVAIHSVVSTEEVRQAILNVIMAE